MKKKKIIIVSLLFTLGIFLLSLNTLSGIFFEKWLNESQSEILSGISKESIEENLGNISEEEDMFDYGAIKNINNGLIPPRIDIENMKNAIGVITIPSVDLEEPILYGTTNENLLLGATTMKPEQKMGEGNYTLVGHNHLTKNIFFQPIRYIPIGEKIYVTDKEKVYTYEVKNKEVVEPTRVDVLNDVEGKKLITLVSCHAADGSDRIIVTGELVDISDYED